MLPWAGGWAKRYDPFTTVSDTRTWTRSERRRHRRRTTRSDRAATRTSASPPAAPPRFEPVGASTTSKTTFGVQHQLLPRLSVFGGYFHRHFYNQEAQKNPLLTSADWTPFQVANPLGNGETDHAVQPEPGQGRRSTPASWSTSTPTSTEPSTTASRSASRRACRSRSTVFGGWTNDRVITVTCDQYDPNKLRFCDQTGQDVPGVRQDVDAAVPQRLQDRRQLPARVGHRSQRRVHELRRQGQQLHRAGPVARRVLVGAGDASSPTVSARASSPRRRSCSPAGTQTQAPGVNLISPNTKFQERWNQLDLSAKRTFTVRQQGVPGAVRGVQRDERQRRPPGSADLRRDPRTAAELPPGAHDATGAAHQLLRIAPGERGTRIPHRIRASRRSSSFT